MCRWSRLLLVTLLAGGLVRTADAQLPKPTQPALTVYAAPSTLQASSSKKAQVTLGWPAVKDATHYRITRIDNAPGATEYPIAELTAASFAFEGASCVAGSGLPSCAYIDVSTTQANKRPLSSAGTFYDHLVTSGATYTYRVWSIFPGPVVSPPSPPATVQVK